jgi:hypothetical protein
VVSQRVPQKLSRGFDGWPLKLPSSLVPHACLRDGGEKGDDDEHLRGAKQRWSQPNIKDEGPRLDPLGFQRGAKQRQGGASR